MANKLPTMGDFEIPGALIDKHEWIADAFIDGELGVDCILYFPSKRAECDNCIFDTFTDRSSNIYKSGGPIPFANHALCPRCNGAGFLEMPVTETIRMRIYWEPRAWRDIGVTIADPQGLCMAIGYMDDLQSLQMANTIVIHDEIKNIRNYKCVRSGEAQPWGFRRNRYFRQMLQRTGGG